MIKEQQVDIKELLTNAVGALESIQDLPSRVMDRVISMAGADPQLQVMLNTLNYQSEAFAVQQLLLDLRRCGPLTSALPMNEADTIRSEFSLNIGRADVVVFHIDGTVSVIEVKDGATGYRSVVAGIGQATMYSCQIGRLHGSVTGVRRVLAWSRIGNKKEDDLLQESCKLAGVIPVIVPSRADLIAGYKALLLDQHKGFMQSIANEAGFESFDTMVDEILRVTEEANASAAQIIERAKGSSRQAQ